MSRQFSVLLKNDIMKGALIAIARENGATICDLYEREDTVRWPWFVYQPDNTLSQIAGARVSFGTVVTIEEMIDLLSGPKTVLFKLNSEYTAEIDKANKIVKVGCQTFSFAKVKALANKIEKL